MKPTHKVGPKKVARTTVFSSSDWMLARRTTNSKLKLAHFGVPVEPEVIAIRASAFSFSYGAAIGSEIASASMRNRRSITRF